MEIYNHPLCNVVLTSDQPSVAPLPVHDHTSEHGRCAISFWKPSREEIAQMVLGGTISLWIYGDDFKGHPVVAVGVQEASPTIQAELRDAWVATGNDGQSFADWVMNMANDPNGTMQQAAQEFIDSKVEH